MKRISMILCILSFLMVCSGCGLFGDQEYVCDEAKVVRIRIIQLDKYVVGEYRYEYTVLCEVEDRSTFIERLNNMKHSVNWGEPSQFDVGYVVIRIDYQNGDYDLLYPNSQWFARSGVNQDGYFFFDQAEFDQLINSALSD